MRQQWQEVPVEVIPENSLDLYKKRKEAVDMYIDGYKLSDIELKTGILHNRLPSLINKCIGISESGVTGYSALIPNIRRRTSGVGNFSRLLKEHPELEEFIDGNYFGNKKYTLEKNMNLTTLHEKFLLECLRIGIQQHEYPFNTENRGYVSLCKYIQKLKSENINKQAKRENANAMQKIYSTGLGKRHAYNALAPFNTVQIDGHIIDMIYNIEIVNNDGTINKTIATRAWLIAVIDVATRCILGYSVSQEFTYNQYDVIEALKNSITPHQEIKLNIRGLKYPPNGGYYSLAYPELKYALFDTIMLDNAKSHLADNTIRKIVDDLKSAINFGSVATPETRGIIERFFGSLETRGFHKLPSTTGSNINDLKRKEPEATSIKYDITYDEITELLEILIAEYNNTPNSGIDNLSPLECMRKKIFEAGMTPTMADETMISVVEKLNFRTDTRKVVGGTKAGKRAYINFMGTEYRSNKLALTGNYIGQTITIIYNPKDISTVEAYTSDGLFIDTLVARGEFGTKSHSVKTRKNATKFAREQGRKKQDYNMSITTYEEHLNAKGKKSRRAATQADIVRREQGKPTYSELQKEQTKNKENCTKASSKNEKEFAYEDIKDLTPYELYNLMFGDKR